MIRFGPVTLPVATLARVLHLAGVGVLPIVLAPAAGWRPTAGELGSDRQVRAEFAELGWFDRHGRLDADVEPVLRTLTAATTEFYGWITEGRTTTGVYGGAIGNLGLLAVRSGDAVALRQAAPARLVELLIAQVPEVPAGRGRPISLPLADLVAAPGVVRVQRATVEVRRARLIAALPTTGSGEFHVASRDALGRRVHCGHPLRTADTAQGRYFTLRTESLLLIAPAARDDLVARLRELCAVVAQN